MSHPITLDDVRRAADGLKGIALRTPLLENHDVNAALGGRLLLKCENLQHTGAFKLRGAYWRMRQLSQAELARGVISYSSGNHALGLATAARMLGASALIVMPQDAPKAKIAAVRALGAEIVMFDRAHEVYDEVVATLIKKTGRTEVPPSAHADVMAGAGTVALEMIEDGPEMDAILTPCGGGGITAATAIVASELAPNTQVFAAEPELFDDTRRSLIAQTRLPNPKGQTTICDAVMTPIPGAFTFPTNLALLAGGLIASDTDVVEAMRFAFDHFNIVVEPGAAVGLAVVLNGQIDIKGKTIATVITGGNIDAARFNSLLQS